MLKLILMIVILWAFWFFVAWISTSGHYPTKGQLVGGATIFWAITIVIMVFIVKANLNVWNDGECWECQQGAYEVINVTWTGGRFSTRQYVCKCDNCGNIITLGINPNGLKKEEEG